MDKPEADNEIGDSNLGILPNGDLFNQYILKWGNTPGVNPEMRIFLYIHPLCIHPLYLTSPEKRG